MNAEPHVHEIKVKREFDLIGQGALVVTYGDTSVKVKGSDPSGTFRADRKLTRKPEKLAVAVEKAIRRAVEKHDLGSAELTIVPPWKVVAKEMRERVEAAQGRWAKDVL